MTLTNNDLALLPREDVGPSAVHTILFYNGYVILVWNKEGTLPNGIKKDAGWGTPGGRVRENESPFQAAKREVYEELGAEIEKEDIKIYPKPLFVKKGVDRRDFYFVGEVPLSLDLPVGKKIEVRDPDENVSFFTVISPFDVKKKNGSGFFLFKSERVYSRHMDAVEIALGTDPQTLK